MAFCLLPAYAVLWTAGVGCGDEDLESVDELIRNCDPRLNASTDRVGNLRVPGGQRTDLFVVESGVDIAVPVGTGSITGFVDGSSTRIESAVELELASGRGLVEWPLDMTVAGGTVSGTFVTTAVSIQSGDRLTYWIRPDAEVTSFAGGLTFSADLASLVQGGFPATRFATPARGAKATTLFRAEFGIDYFVPTGTLTFKGRVSSLDGTRSSIPKKLSVKLEHLDRDGKSVAKHKQKIRIRRNGEFKPSNSAFKGFDVKEGESVRLKVKPKKGGLFGLAWELVPFLNY